MMSRVLRALVMVALGLILLAAAWRGHKSGELRAGLSGLRPYRPNRDDNPLGFYFHLGLYSLVGAAWAVWGILAFLGLVKPARWR